MAHGRYTAQFKTEVVLEVLQGEKELGEIATHYNLNPNTVISGYHPRNRTLIAS